MGKIDFKKELKRLCRASAKAVEPVAVPTLRYLMVDGEGDPNTSPAYAQAVEALFSVAYTAKFMLKRGPQALNFAVMPLVGPWWADDMAAFRANDRSQWKWTMMILQSDVVADETIHTAIEQVRKKKRLPGVDGLRRECFAEGLCAQVLHAFIGSVSSLRGKHHEICLSDIRRTDPGKWKTIIRQPMT